MSESSAPVIAPDALDAATPAVRARGLCKTYGEGVTAVHALEEIAYEISQGEFVVMLGPSGSGKTTMLNVVGALDSPTGGQLEVMGNARAEMDEGAQTRYRLGTVGFIFQFFNLVPTLTALENVALLAELTGEDAESRARAVLGEVGLADRVDHFPCGSAPSRPPARPPRSCQSGEQKQEAVRMPTKMAEGAWTAERRSGG
ncbi:MAG: ATP-binding cassette domain-containing protein [Coriobacteriia bacterium]|nr:ATP-binding cassette domain-containing protein [Coriobacteriia bacterium]